VILLSLALVVASAVALAWGMFASNDPLVWASLAAGVGAVALVAGSVVRHRRHLVPEAMTDTGPAAAGSGAWPGVPQSPWATPPPGGSPAADPRSGWTGPVPAVHPPTADPAPSDPEPGRTTAPVAGAAPETDPAAADLWSGGPESDGARIDSAEPGEPGVERLAVRDALRVAQLPDEVVVVDGHPRYHLAGCPTLQDAQTIPLAVSVARRIGFTPCAVCGPDATLLTRSRARTEQRAGQSAPDPTAEWFNGEGQQV
jgi:hypothetical protein